MSAWLEPYERTKGSSAHARTAWREVVDIACEHEGFAVVLGASLGSLYLEPLGEDTFLVHISGEADERQDLLRSTLSVVGEPDPLIGWWPREQEQIFSRLREVSILPIALDGFEDVPTPVLDRILEPPRDAHGTPAWRNVVFGGGQRLWRAVESGWVEVPVPVSTEKDVLQRVVDLTTEHHGWPLAWLSESRILADDPSYTRLTGVLESLSPPAGRALARQLAVCVVGFGILGRLVGHPLAVYAGIAAAERILERFATSVGSSRIGTASLVSVVPTGHSER